MKIKPMTNIHKIHIKVSTLTKKMITLLLVMIMVSSSLTGLDSSALTAAQQNFIEKIGISAQRYYPTYKILPSLTIAQACLESSYGASALAQHYNFFGMTAGSSWTGKTCTIGSYKYRSYNSYDEGIKGYYDFITGISRYSNIIGETDYKKACQKIKDDGWAEDPSYTSKLIKIIESNGLTKYDSGLTKYGSSGVSSTSFVNKAVAYAIANWNGPAQYAKDCANFVSKCLVQGGVSAVKGIAGCQALYSKLKSMGVPVIKKMAAKDVRAGDIVLHDPSGKDNINNLHHTAIVTFSDGKGNVGVAAHTNNRGPCAGCKGNGTWYNSSTCNKASWYMYSSYWVAQTSILLGDSVSPPIPPPTYLNVSIEKSNLKYGENAILNITGTDAQYGDYIVYRNGAWYTWKTEVNYDRDKKFVLSDLPYGNYEIEFNGYKYDTGSARVTSSRVQFSVSANPIEFTVNGSINGILPANEELDVTLSSIPLATSYDHAIKALYGVPLPAGAEGSDKEPGVLLNTRNITTNHIHSDEKLEDYTGKYIKMWAQARWSEGVIPGSGGTAFAKVGPKKPEITISTAYDGYETDENGEIYETSDLYIGNKYTISWVTTPGATYYVKSIQLLESEINPDSSAEPTDLLTAETSTANGSITIDLNPEKMMALQAGRWLKVYVLATIKGVDGSDISVSSLYYTKLKLQEPFFSVLDEAEIGSELPIYWDNVPAASEYSVKVEQLDGLSASEADEAGTVLYNGSVGSKTILNYVLNNSKLENDKYLKITVTAKSKEGVTSRYYSYTKLKSHTTDLASADVYVLPSALTYNGTKQSPSFLVRCSGRVLQEGTDYTISGTASATETGLYNVTIQGKGEFSGSYQGITWMIISNNTIEISSMATYAYDGKIKTPSFVVSSNGRVLTLGKDYELDTEFGDLSACEAGVYIIIARGIGNYEGEAVGLWEITPVDLSDAVLTVDNSSFTYNGASQKPNPSVALNGKQLILNTDYFADESEDSINAGDYTLYIYGCGNYAGVLSTKYAINKAVLDSVTVTPGSYIYNGTTQTPSIVVKSGNNVLRKDVDYILNGTSSTAEAGTYSFTAVGLNNYSGASAGTWSIAPARGFTITVSESSYTYDGNAKTPVVTVKSGDIVLQKDKDYSLSGTLSEVGSGSYLITASGLGNYAGSANVRWRIAESNTMQFVPAETEFSYDGTAKIPDFKLKAGDTVLNEGIDYTLSGTQSATGAGYHTVTAAGIGNYAASTVTLGWRIFPAEITSMTLSNTSYTFDTYQKIQTVKAFAGGTELSSVTDYDITGDVTGTTAGNYKITVKGKNNYTGVLSAEWTVSPAGNLSARISQNSYNYSGSAISPSITVTSGGYILTPDSYTISGNISAAEIGAYTVKITGQRNYSGVVYCQWQITPAESFDAKLVSNSYKYDGFEKAADIMVTSGEKTLVEDVDYTVVGTASATDTGKYQVSVFGIGGYTGLYESLTWFVTPLYSQNISFDSDVFSFTNTASNFSDDGDGNGLNDYEMSKRALEILLQGLSPAERQRVLNEKSSDWGGSSFGMAAVIALVKSGAIEPSYFQISANKISDMYSPRKNLAVESLVNYYQLMSVTNRTRGAMFKYTGLSAETRNKNLIDAVRSSAYPVVVNLTYTQSGKSASHSLAAYKVIEDDYRYYIYTADPNDLTKPLILEISLNYSTASFADNSKYNSNLAVRGALRVEDNDYDYKNLQKGLSGYTEAISGNQVRTVIETNYQSFIVKKCNATGSVVSSAQVVNGVKTAGSLNIYGGVVSETGAEYHGLWYAEDLGKIEYYIITPFESLSGKYKTMLMNSDNTNGYLNLVTASASGEIHFYGNGVVATDFENSALHTIEVTQNNFAEKWYTAGVSGKTTSLQVIPSTKTLSFTCIGSSSFDVTASNDFIKKSVSLTVKSIAQYTMTTAHAFGNINGILNSNDFNIEIKEGKTVHAATQSYGIAVDTLERAAYIGETVIPSKIIVSYNDETLVYGSDYTIAFNENIKIGKGTVIICGTGKYSGIVSSEFDIVAPKAGDFNADLSVDMFDVIYYKDAKKGNEKFYNNSEYTDTNGDKKINGLDLIHLKRKVG